MVGSRSRASLAQFLELQQFQYCMVFLDKHGIYSSFGSANLLLGLHQSLGSVSHQQMLTLLEEIVRTENDLKSRVSPKYRFTERWEDLIKCLLLDGYLLAEKKLVLLDPSINDAIPMDDDLIAGLKASRPPRFEEIIRKINDSSNAFRAQPPNYNASLNDSRVALETLAVDIALDRCESNRYPGVTKPDFSKWGAVINYLRQVDLITVEEEKGLVGVYGFVSPGSHRPIGVSDEHMARLGRSFAMNMSWFLLKRQMARLNEERGNIA